ncbi:MAG: hypothetical protein K2N91_09310 [Muribaculaceae bacterium]|nr:hypothetical protein [Muribaculaceae bacterium]
MNLQKSLKLTAIGVLLVNAPVLPLFLCIGCEWIGMGILLCLVQFAGAMIWNAGLSRVISWSKERKIVIPGIKTTQGGAICVSISVLFMMFFLGSYSSYYYYDIFDSAYAGFAILSFQAAMIVLWCGLNKLDKFFRPLEIAKVGYIMSTFFMFVIGVFSELPYASNAIAIILYIVGILVLELIGWWRVVAYAAAAEKKAAEMTQPLPEVTVTAAPESVGPPPFEPNQQPASMQRPDEKTMAYLMSLDDETLKNMVSRRDAKYALSASLVLELRQAWEEIKDFSDDQLDKMLTVQTGIYTDAVLDAASMELYQRRSPLLFDKINKMPMSEIRNMARGDSGYYDGYVRAAREIVNSLKT